MTRDVDVVDVREWLTGHIAERDERRRQGLERRHSRYAGNDSLEVKVSETITLSYRPSVRDGAPADGYELTTEVPAGTKVVIYGSYGKVASGSSLMAVFRGQEALVTLQKDRGFRAPRTRQLKMSRSTRRVA